MKFFFLLLFFFLLFFAGKSQDLSFDIKNAPAPLFRCPIYDGATDPTVMWHKQRKEWWILYTQRRANQSLPPYVAQVYGCAIGIAASKDQGRSWYYVGTASLPQPDKGHNTFWAPHVFADNKGLYHMIVTYIPGVYVNWGGDCRLVHYTSKDMMNWKWKAEIPDTHECIDASVFQLADGTWKMWYKDTKSNTSTFVSKNLNKWIPSGSEISDNGHEGPVVFFWKNKYWMVTDECSLGYVGLHIYESTDATHWKRNNTILNKPGKREDDADQGRHCDVRVVGDKAYIFYFTHPGRSYNPKTGIEYEENTWQYHRASIQVAELELKDGTITCDRDKYFKQ